MKNLSDRNYIIGAHFFKFTHGSGRSCDGFWKEIVKEISIFARFNAKDGWEIWLITGVSSLTFTAFIKSKNKGKIQNHDRNSITALNHRGSPYVIDIEI